jgi:hypothetical protein
LSLVSLKTLPSAALNSAVVPPAAAELFVAPLLDVSPLAPEDDPVEDPAAPLVVLDAELFVLLLLLQAVMPSAATTPMATAALMRALFILEAPHLLSVKSQVLHVVGGLP